MIIFIVLCVGLYIICIIVGIVEAITAVIENSNKIDKELKEEERMRLKNEQTKREFQERRRKNEVKK